MRSKVPTACLQVQNVEDRGTLPGFESENFLIGDQFSREASINPRVALFFNFTFCYQRHVHLQS